MKKLLIPFLSLALMGLWGCDSGSSGSGGGSVTGGGTVSGGGTTGGGGEEVNKSPSPAISVGDSHSLFVSKDGKVYAWGDNSFWQLGNASISRKTNVPVAVDASGVLNGKKITALAAGNSFSLVLADDGTLYSWGINNNGQLGNGSMGVDVKTPAAVDMSGVLNGKKIIAIAAGRDHSLALADDGTLYSWGDNANGQLGNGLMITDVKTPAAVDMSGVLNGKKITAIAAGTDHSLVLADDGALYSWGHNEMGQLGDNNPGGGINSVSPVAVNMSGVLNGKKITALAAGNSFSLVLADDGTVYSWGINDNGQLGNGSMGADVKTPAAVDMSGVLNGKKIIAIAAGRDHSLVLADDGTLYAWGSNSHMQLGIDNSGNPFPGAGSPPVAVNMSGAINGKKITAIAAGNSFSLVLADDGAVYAWGDNSQGKLGNGGDDTTYIPTAVDMTNITQ